MSRRQVDALFVWDILPGLTAALEREFADWFESDREEAAQDCVCLALEAYRAMRIHGRTIWDVEPAALAAHASRKYLSGVRFAASGRAAR
jgi:hypothetical protein